MTATAAFTELSARLAAARTLDATPTVIDLTDDVPPNPPEAIQTQFVGLSYLDAYAEAASFVAVADEWTAKHTRRPLANAGAVLDFGSGWGRISRMLLHVLPATAIYALDVDPLMTALINTTLPGLNAMTVTANPPIVLGDASMDVAVAFSVFSHLAPEVHDRWAQEFGRVVKSGGMVTFTVLDRGFLDVVEEAKAKVADGTALPFHTDMASQFDDIDTTIRDFENGIAAYSGNGGGGIRTGDFYGWAAIPKAHIVKVWGAAGFDLVEWVPSGVLFPQAMVGLVRRGRLAGGMSPRRGYLVGRRVVREVAARAKQDPRVRRIFRKP